MSQRVVLDMLFREIALKIPKKNQELLYDRINRANEETLSELVELKLKSPQLGFALGLCFGFLGADRFYRGVYVSALMKFLLCFGSVFIFQIASLAVALANKYTAFNNILGENHIFFSLVDLHQAYGIIFLACDLIVFLWVFIDLLFMESNIKQDNLRKVQNIFITPRY